MCQMIEVLDIFGLYGLLALAAILKLIPKVNLLYIKLLFSECFTFRY